MSSAFVEGIIICLVLHTRNLRDMLTSPLFLESTCNNGWLVLKSMPMSSSLLPGSPHYSLCGHYKSLHTSLPINQSKLPKLTSYIVKSGHSWARSFHGAYYCVHRHSTSTTIITPCPQTHSDLSHLLWSAVFEMMQRTSYVCTFC